MSASPAPRAGTRLGERVVHATAAARASSRRVRRRRPCPRRARPRPAGPARRTATTSRRGEHDERRDQVERAAQVVHRDAGGHRLGRRSAAASACRRIGSTTSAWTPSAPTRRAEQHGAGGRCVTRTRSAPDAARTPRARSGSTESASIELRRRDVARSVAAAAERRGPRRRRCRADRRSAEPSGTTADASDAAANAATQTASVGQTGRRRPCRTVRSSPAWSGALDSDSYSATPLLSSTTFIGASCHRRARRATVTCRAGRAASAARSTSARSADLAGTEPGQPRVGVGEVGVRGAGRRRSSAGRARRARAPAGRSRGTARRRRSGGAPRSASPEPDVGDVAGAVEEEDVPAEPLAGRARLDPGQVDAAYRQFGQHREQRADPVVRDVDGERGEVVAGRQRTAARAG